MKKIAILLADGFEEIEALTPRDVLNRAGFTCNFITINKEEIVKSTHGVTIVADNTIDECGDFEEYDMVVLPGGMPGAKYLSENSKVIEVVKRFNEQENIMHYKY